MTDTWETVLGPAPAQVPARVLAIGLDAATVRRWLGAKAQLVETAPDFLHAVGRLWDERWDVVVAGIEEIENDLRSWLDAVDQAPGQPTLIAVVKQAPDPESHNDSLTLAEVEARHITSVLKRTGGQITETARLLGIHRNTLTRKLKAIRLVNPVQLTLQQ